MDGAYLLFLFIPALFGALFLMLLLGYRSVEQERSKEEETSRESRDNFIPVPRFFARLSPERPADVAEGVNESVLRGVQRYLEMEQASAEEFVSRPSVDRLYRKTGRISRAS